MGNEAADEMANKGRKGCWRAWAPMDSLAVASHWRMRKRRRMQVKAMAMDAEDISEDSEVNDNLEL